MKNKNREKNSKASYILTRETMGMTLMLFSAILLIMLLSGSAVFAGIGLAICTFMYGTFGYGSLLIALALAYLGEWLTFGKAIKISLKTSLAIALVVFCAFLLFHAAVTRNYELATYGGYIADCYNNAVNGFSGYTFGGVISAIIVFPFAKLTTFVGAMIIFSLLTIASGYLLYVILRRRRALQVKGYSQRINSEAAEQPAEKFEERSQEVLIAAPAAVSAVEVPEAVRENEVKPVKVKTLKEDEEDNNPYSQKNLGRKILFEKGEFDAESYRRNMIFNESSYFNNPIHNESDYLSSFSSGNSKSVPAKSYSESYQEEVLNQPAVSAPTNYVYGDKPVDKLDEYEEATEGTYPAQSIIDKPADIDAEESYSQTIREKYAYGLDEPAENTSADRIERTEREQPKVILPERKERASEERSERTIQSAREEEQKTEAEQDKVDVFKLFGASGSRNESNRVEPDLSRLASRRQECSNANLFDDDGEDEEETFTSLTRNGVSSERSSLGEARSRENEINKIEARKVEEQPAKREIIPAEKSVQPAAKPAVQPVKEELKQEEKPKHVWKKYVRPGLDLLDDYPEHSNVNTGEIEDNKHIIVETLAKFKINSEVSNVIIGPAVTRYDVIIEDKTKITQSLKYREAIAMALMKDNVAAYLNYSKGALSIEVPNNKRTVVGLKSMLTSQNFINSKSNTITFALGKNVEGEVMCPDITKMPHLLVAGTTGSGKSICLSSLIISLLYKYGPEELRFILVDPKQVEFISYDKLPHLMINEIIYDVDKAIKALNWANKEMERRYSLFKEMTEQGRATKNLEEYNNHLPEGEEKLPKIVIILDEFGDLMIQAKKDIEGRIIKLVQKARACGIHLILATQRPSVDCITGLIKSNLPTRIGFKVNSFDDSRTIFDIGGAEKLLGKGDMYFRSSEYPDLLRIQGCFVDSHEIQKVTDFIKAHNETYFDQSVSDFINKVEVEENNSMGPSEETGSEGGDAKIDETYVKALCYCVTSNQASVSMIQRRFPVGYIKACKIIDWMETMNYITHSEGSKPRKVLLSKEDFISAFGEIDD